MTHRIILFRGMNTGGVRAPVAEQRAMAEEMGLKNPRTLQASGNLVVESGKATAALEHDIETAMDKTFGLKVAAMVRTPDQWAKLIAANPFPKQAGAAPARVLVWAMREPLPDAGLEQLQRRASADEKVVRTADGDIYMWFGGDIDASKLPAGFGLKSLGAVGTNRNWNTMKKITAVLDEMEAAR